MSVGHMPREKRKGNRHAAKRQSAMRAAFLARQHSPRLRLGKPSGTLMSNVPKTKAAQQRRTPRRKREMGSAGRPRFGVRRCPAALDTRCKLATRLATSISAADLCEHRLVLGRNSARPNEF